MNTVTLPRDLSERLVLAARRLGRAPEDCALSAIRAWVEDCEHAAAQARALSGTDVVRPPEDFMD